jgi:tyrosine-protein kinase Etk/Wzc
VNLAIALVRRSFRVLLIEADLHADALAVIFDQPAREGFFEWRRGEHLASQLAKSTTLPGLTFMPAGVPSPEQSDPAFDIRREKHRWDSFNLNYDCVILYCPSILAVKYPAAAPVRPILDAADYVLVQVRKSRSLPQQTAHIESALQPHSARLFGLIAVHS